MHYTYKTQIIIFGLNAENMLEALAKGTQAKPDSSQRPGPQAGQPLPSTVALHLQGSAAVSLRRGHLPRVAGPAQNVPLLATRYSALHAVRQVPNSKATVSECDQLSQGRVVSRLDS